MILFWDTALWKWQRGAVDLIRCAVYSFILRVSSPYIHHPALSGLFLDSLSLFHCPKHLALFYFLAVFRSCSIVCCAALEVVWRKRQWGWQEKNWTLCRDSTKYSKVIRIQLEQVINESSMAVTGQSNIYRTSISIAAAERKQWSLGAPRPAGVHVLIGFPKILRCLWIFWLVLEGPE